MVKFTALVSVSFGFSWLFLSHRDSGINDDAMFIYDTPEELG